jgi:hypothetical protein
VLLLAIDKLGKYYGSVFGCGCGCGKDHGDLKSPPEIKDPMIFPEPEQIRGI